MGIWVRQLDISDHSAHTCMVLSLNFTDSIQPHEAIQRRAREDHTSVFWFFDDFNLARAGNIARQKSAALVFIAADSGEAYITVDGNEGDRCVFV